MGIGDIRISVPTPALGLGGLDKIHKKSCIPGVPPNFRTHMSQLYRLMNALWAPNAVMPSIELKNASARAFWRARLTLNVLKLDEK